MKKLSFFTACLLSLSTSCVSVVRESGATAYSDDERVNLKVAYRKAEHSFLLFSSRSEATVLYKIRKGAPSLTIAQSDSILKGINPWTQKKFKTSPYMSFNLRTQTVFPLNLTEKEKAYVRGLTNTNNDDRFNMPDYHLSKETEKLLPTVDLIIPK